MNGIKDSMLSLLLRRRETQRQLINEMAQLIAERQRAERTGDPIKELVAIQSMSLVLAKLNTVTAQIVELVEACKE